MYKTIASPPYDRISIIFAPLTTASLATIYTDIFLVYTWGVQVVRYPNFFSREWKQIET